jgi:hypothetical protein
LIVSVDPGVRGCGVALWQDAGPLDRAAYVVNPVRRGLDAAAALSMADAVFQWMPWQPKALVIECPRVYDATFQKGDQNTSIIPLTLVVGAIVGRCNVPVTQYFPRDWKGTVDADTVCIPLIKERLSEIERSRVQLPSAEDLAHNVWDGIGVGLKFLRRFEPNRVFAKEKS